MKKRTITQLISAGLITALILTGCAAGNSKKTVQTSSPVQTTQVQTDDAGETKPATTVSKPDNSTDKTDTKTGDTVQQETEKEDAKESEEKDDGMIGEAAAYEKEESKEEDIDDSESEDGTVETAATGKEQKTENSTGSDNTASVIPSNNSTSSNAGTAGAGNTSETTTTTTPSATPSTGTVAPTVTEETYTYETVLCTEMLALVNNRRTSVYGTSSLTWASDLDSYALTYARGLVDNFNHPTGAVGLCNCIHCAGWYEDAAAIHTEYVNSAGHDTTIHKTSNITRMTSATCYKKNSSGEIVATYNIVILDSDDSSGAVSCDGGPIGNTPIEDDLIIIY